MTAGSSDEKDQERGAHNQEARGQKARDRETHPPIALPEGTRLRDEYRVEAVLGTGGFGITYRCRDEHLQADVAVKEYYPRQIAGRTGESSTIRPHSSEETEDFEYGLQQFMEEGRTLARFDHPNVVDVRSYFEENGTGYLVMDYYEGQSLTDYLTENGGRLPEDEAVGLIQDVLAGLEAVHESGVLHRDIDPQNIYRTKEGEAILIDFGAAREAMGAKSQSLDVILKPGYAPIEQYSASGDQGPHTDIYACAATLYKCLTGLTPQESTERVQEDTLVSPHEVRSEIAMETSFAVKKGLALYPDRRLQSAREFATLLERAHTAEGKTQATSETEATAITAERKTEDTAPKDSPVQVSGTREKETGSPSEQGTRRPVEEAISESGAKSLLTLSGVAISVVAATLLFSDAGTTKILGFFGTWAALAVGIVVLFREGEKAMSQEARAAVSDWLLQESFVNRPSDWPETFIDLFDAVFTEDHFSWACFWRSAVVSVTGAIVISGVLWMLGVFSRETFIMSNISENTRPSFNIQIALTLVSAVIYNSIFDYLSLFETRKVLSYTESHSYDNQLIIILLDLFLTLLIIYFGMLFIIYSINVYLIPSRAYAIFKIEEILDLLYSPLRAIYSVYPMGDSLPTALIYSTFITSVWVWTYVLSGYVIRLVYPFVEGVSFLKDSLDIRGRPVHSMGVLIAGFLSVVFALSAPFVL